MDQTDTKILKVLDKDPTISTSRVAKQCRVSQQVAHYRITNLVDRSIITKFGTIINLSSLGQEHYRIFFTFLPKAPIEKIFDFLRQKQGVYWAARIGGKYDLLIVLFVYSFEQFDLFLDELHHAFRGAMKEYKACYCTQHTFYHHKYLSGKSESISYGVKDKRINIDPTDFSILLQLKDNCRKSSLEMSRPLHVSYKTIINRVKRMKTERIILGSRLFLKSEEKKPFIILFSFRNYSKDEEKKLLGYLAELESVTQVVRMFGLWNLFVHVRLDSDEQLQNLVADIRNQFDIIETFELIPVFSDIAINLLPFKSL